MVVSVPLVEALDARRVGPMELPAVVTGVDDADALEARDAALSWDHGAVAACGTYRAAHGFRAAATF